MFSDQLYRIVQGSKLKYVNVLNEVLDVYCS